MAFVIAGFPSVLAGEAVAKTTFPAYSRLQGNVELVVDLFRDVFTLTCGLCIPAGIALYILAPAFTTIVLGPKWADAVEPLQLLVAYGALRSIVYTFQPLYKAVGRPDIVWKLNVVRLVILAPAMWWSVRDGIAGVAAVQAVIYAVMIPLNGVWLASTVGLPLRGLGRLLLPHTVAGTAACGLVWLVQRSQLGERAVLNPIGSMVVTALAMVTFLGVVALLSPRAVALMRAGLGAISGWQRGAPLSLAWTARRAL
jgi:PST family polysaccharide transporter/lipopolysaccharide exporter